MDIFSFINSKAIAEHLKKIEYKFTATECAFLVWQCKSKTIKQKNEAWQEIIDAMPDETIPQKGIHPEISLHEFLKRYMQIEDNGIKDFIKKQQDFVYAYKFYSNGDCEWEGDYEDWFSTYDNCLNAISKYKDKDLQMINIKVQRFEAECENGELYLLPTILDGNNIVESAIYIYPRGMNDEEYEIYHRFEDMWMLFPTPFKKGDILIEGDFGYSPKRTQPFVFCELCERGTDISDMTAYGYFVSKTGRIYYECMHDYLNLEYADEQTKQKYNGLLLNLSSRLSDEMYIEWFLNLYKVNREDRRYGKMKYNLEEVGMYIAKQQKQEK
jgi:hypothetical protein